MFPFQEVNTIDVNEYNFHSLYHLIFCNNTLNFKILFFSTVVWRSYHRYWDLGLLGKTEILQQGDRVSVWCHLWYGYCLLCSGGNNIYPGLCRMYRCSQGKHIPPKVCKYMFLYLLLIRLYFGPYVDRCQKHLNRST